MCQTELNMGKVWWGFFLLGSCKAFFSLSAVVQNPEHFVFGLGLGSTIQIQLLWLWLWESHCLQLSFPLLTNRGRRGGRGQQDWSSAQEEESAGRLLQAHHLWHCRYVHRSWHLQALYEGRVTSKVKLTWVFVVVLYCFVSVLVSLMLQRLIWVLLTCTVL